VAFISQRVVLRLKLAGAARWSRMERGSEGWGGFWWMCMMGDCLNWRKKLVYVLN
jgi:hypothetical protein